MRLARRCSLAALAALRRGASTAAERPFAVIGCGSNVVDRFFAVRALPRPGEKGFFRSPTKIQEGLLVGGVTLNHLSWAAALGARTALLARQGDEEAGRTVRTEMGRCRVSAELLDVSSDNTTSESYVFLEPRGERSIIMASGSTSTIDADCVRRLWSGAPAQGAILSTEISQVPLSGVAELLRLAAAAGTVTALDVDVSPTVALSEAGLGTEAELLQCVRSAQILKPARHAAEELLGLLDPAAGQGQGMDGEALAEALLRSSGAQMVALTEGGDGSVVAVSGAPRPVRIPIVRIDAVRDATGAGDAFFGGLLAALHHYGLPWQAGDPVAAAERAGRVAAASGAACCQALGGLPPEGADLGRFEALCPLLPASA